MNFDETEYYIIDELAKEVPIDQIHYSLEKDYDVHLKLESITQLAEKLKNKIIIQKEINKRRIEQNVDKLVLRMENCLDDLAGLINKMKINNFNENAPKIMVSAIQQVNALVNTLLKATGQLKENQKANISNYYIELTQVNNFVKQNILKILDELDEVTKEKIKRAIAVESTT